MQGWLKEILAKPTTSVPEAGKCLGIGKNASYDAASRGEIKVVAIGKQKRVPTAWLRRKLDLDAE